MQVQRQHNLKHRMSMLVVKGCCSEIAEPCQKSIRLPKMWHRVAEAIKMRALVSIASVLLHDTMAQVAK